jgi:hypothetical protein
LLSNKWLLACTFTFLKIFPARIAEGNYPAGMHSVLVNRENLPGGTYFYQLRFNGLGVTKKMLVL